MIRAFIAHPLRGDIDGNIALAKEWYRTLSDEYPDRAFLLSWVVDAEVFDDAIEGQRAVGIRRNLAHIEGCHELWAVGDRVTPGMWAEIQHAWAHGVTVYRACSGRVQQWSETLAGVSREVSDNCRPTVLDRLRRWFAPGAPARAEL